MLRSDEWESFGEFTEELTAILAIELPERRAHSAVTLYGKLERAIKAGNPQAEAVIDELLTKVFALPAGAWKR